MNKRQIIAGGIIVACIIGSGLYVYFNNNKSTQLENNKPQSSNTQKESEKINPPKTIAKSSVAGKYVDYSSQALAKSVGTKILFFHAPWCPQCRAVEKSIKNSELPDNVTIFKVDYDSSQNLREKYGVTLQTTFVKVDNSGNKIKSFVAYDEPTFAAVKRELL